MVTYGSFAEVGHTAKLPNGLSGIVDIHIVHARFIPKRRGVSGSLKFFFMLETFLCGSRKACNLYKIYLLILRKIY